MTLDLLDRGAGDFRVRSHGAQLDLEIIGHASDTVDSLDRLLGRVLFPIAGNVSRQCYNAVLNRHGNIVRRYFRVPIQLRYDVRADCFIGSCYWFNYGSHGMYLCDMYLCSEVLSQPLSQSLVRLKS